MNRPHTTAVKAVITPKLNPTAHMPTLSRIIPPRIGPKIAPREKAQLYRPYAVA